MAMRDLVAADCGGASALTKLTRHIAKDESRRLIDQGTAARGQQHLRNGMTLGIIAALTALFFVCFQ